MAISRSCNSEDDSIILEIHEIRISLTELCRTIPKDIMFIILGLLNSEDVHKISFNPEMREMCSAVYSQRPEGAWMRLNFFSHQKAQFKIKVEAETERQANFNAYPAAILLGSLTTFISIMALITSHKILGGSTLILSLLVVSCGIISALKKIISQQEITNLNNELTVLNQKINENRCLNDFPSVKYV